MSTLDAYRQARTVRPGCQHQLGCRCDAPYWLRESSPTEQAHERWLSQRGTLPSNTHTGADNVTEPK